MRSLSIALALCAPAVPAAAQLTTTYTGTQRDGDKDVPATAEFTHRKGPSADDPERGTGDAHDLRREGDRRYHWTMVAGMRGNDKTTEYCGSKSNDFKMSDAERGTMLEMQGYLRNFGINAKSGDESRAFQWDTSVDGYPVLTRCYRDGRMTLELQLASVSRTEIPRDAYELPRGYKRTDFGSATAR